MTKKNKKKKTKKIDNEKILKKDVKKHIMAVLLLLFALIFSLGLFEQAGIIGKIIDKILTVLFGGGKYVLPVLMVALGVMYFKKMQPVRYYLATGGMLLFFLAGIGLTHSFYDIDNMAKIANDGFGGGYVGFVIAYSLIKLVGKFAGVASLFSVALIGFMLLFNLPIFNLLYKIKDSLKSDDIGDSAGDDNEDEILINNKYQNSGAVNLDNKEIINEVGHIEQGILSEQGNRNDKKQGKKLFGFLKTMFKDKEEKKQKKIDKLGKNIKSLEFSDEVAPEIINKNINNNITQTKIENDNLNNINKDKKINIKKKPRKFFGKSTWKRPSVSIFEKSKGNGGEKNIETNIKIIQQTLEEFGIHVEPSGYNIGPTVTQYTFSPPPGVMLNKIVGLQNNLALALAASAIRIEAPIPRTSLIGIEAPNSQPTMVRMQSFLKDDKFLSNDTRLTIALGEDVNGNSIITALEKMPHLLVAGSTNTGKSICINAILSALIFKNSPEDLKLILVDPKRVELSAYNGIPHLITKVIVDMNKVVNTLKWATNEMDSRYKELEVARSKNIISYNKKVEMNENKKVVDVETGETKKEPLKKMPYIVIVIDELADLMATNGKEVEALIVRLSQMARAVGIHLILSTQRPDANVITGTIKNNIPARIAFKVGGNVDSRTILDKPGAEKLLGNGDMLYMGPGYPQPTRIQGPFISEEETHKLIKFIKNQAKKSSFGKDESLKESLEDKLSEEIISGDVREGENSGDDVLYNEAKELVIQAGKASISSIQRRLRIGYNRAARIIDLLEDNGVVGPENGSKPREVLIADDVMMVDEVPGPEDVPMSDPLADQEARDKRQF